VAGNGYNLAIKSDGTVVAWGDNGFGQCTVLSGLSNVIAIVGAGSLRYGAQVDFQTFFS
jgi:alpha-tubulin suppressor-like RCC1 family protein